MTNFSEFANGAEGEPASAKDRLETVHERELAMGAAALAYLASCLADVDLPE